MRNTIQDNARDIAYARVSSNGHTALKSGHRYAPGRHHRRGSNGWLLWLAFLMFLLVEPLAQLVERMI